ncbi:MAG: ArnT family glycosyltransferase [Candidatus Woesearchaeota archaeon]
MFFGKMKVSFKASSSSDGLDKKIDHVRAFLEGHHKIFLLVFALIFLGFAFYGAHSDGLCCDEHLYMNVTYTYFHTFDSISLRDTPYLLHIFNVLPIMMADNVGYYDNKDVYSALEDSVFGFSPTLMLARMPSMILGLILMYYMFLFASRLFNKSAGLLAVFLFVIDGNLSTHFHIVSSDGTLAAFMFISVYYLWCYLTSPRLSNYLLFISFGILTLISKISGFYLIILLCLFLPLVVFSKDLRIVLPWKTMIKNNTDENTKGHGVINYKLSERRIFIEKNSDSTKKKFFNYMVFLILTSLIFFIALSLIYFGFHPMKDMVPVGMEDRAEYKLDAIGSKYTFLNGPIHYIYNEVPLPMPVYIKTFGQQLAHSYETQDIYLNGKYSETGFKQYFIYLFFVKMPTLIIFLTLLFAFLFIYTYSRLEKRSDYWFLIIPFVFISFMVSINHVQYGFKYIYPAFPFLYVLISGSIYIVPSKNKEDTDEDTASKKESKKRASKNKPYKKNIYISFMIILSLLIIFSSAELVSNSENLLAYQNFLSRGRTLDSYCIDGCLDWWQNNNRIINYIYSSEIPNDARVYVDFRYYMPVKRIIDRNDRGHNNSLNSMVYPLEDRLPDYAGPKYILITKNVLNCYELQRPCYVWLKNSSDVVLVDTIAKSIKVYRINTG